MILFCLFITYTQVLYFCIYTSLIEGFSLKATFDELSQARQYHSKVVRQRRTTFANWPGSRARYPNVVRRRWIILKSGTRSSYLPYRVRRPVSGSFAAVIDKIKIFWWQVKPLSQYSMVAEGYQILDFSSNYN